MLAITRDGRRGYTSNVGSGTVSVLDLESRKVVTHIPVASKVQRISVSADDRWAFTSKSSALNYGSIAALASSTFFAWLSATNASSSPLGSRPVQR